MTDFPEPIDPLEQADLARKAEKEQPVIRKTPTGYAVRCPKCRWGFESGGSYRGRVAAAAEAHQCTGAAS